MRTLKLALEKLFTVQVLPHVFAVPPKVYVALVVLRVAVLWVVVQVVPPSQESCTHIFGELVVLLTLAVNCTSMP